MPFFILLIVPTVAGLLCVRPRNRIDSEQCLDKSLAIQTCYSISRVGNPVFAKFGSGTDLDIFSAKPLTVQIHLTQIDLDSMVSLLPELRNWKIHLFS